MGELDDLCVLVLFFFKQKTAYEMRISDWSSDVCSSDLGGRWTAIADPKGEYATLAEHLGFTTVKLSPGGTATINPLAPGPAAEHEPADKQILRRAEMCTALIGTVLERTLTQLEEIGRASCRERVCQYV